MFSQLPAFAAHPYLGTPVAQLADHLDAALVLGLHLLCGALITGGAAFLLLVHEPGADERDVRSGRRRYWLATLALILVSGVAGVLVLAATWGWQGTPGRDSFSAAFSAYGWAMPLKVMLYVALAGLAMTAVTALMSAARRGGAISWLLVPGARGGRALRAALALGAAVMLVSAQGEGARLSGQIANHAGMVMTVAADVPTHRLFIGSMRSIAVSSDGGGHWQQVLGMPPGEQVYQLAWDPGDRRIVMAGTADGVYRSRDGGLSWALVAGGDPYLVHGIAFAGSPPAGSSPPRLLAATPNGVFASDNLGDSWQSFDAGLHDSRGLSLLVAPPGEPSAVLLGTVSSIARSDGGGTGWRDSDAGLSRPFTLALAAGGPHRDLALAATAAGIGLSRDGGFSWTLVPEPGTRQLQNAVAVGADGRDLYAGGSGLWHSPDGGLHWSPMITPPDGQVFALTLSEGRLLVGTANRLYSYESAASYALVAPRQLFPPRPSLPLLTLGARWLHQLGLAALLGSLAFAAWLWARPQDQDSWRWRRLWALCGAGLLALGLSGVYLALEGAPLLSSPGGGGLPDLNSPYGVLSAAHGLGPALLIAALAMGVVGSGRAALSRGWMSALCLVVALEALAGVGMLLIQAYSM